MDTKSSYGFILIGLAIRLLRNVKPGYPKSHITIHLTMLEKKLEDNNFAVSLAAINKSKEVAEKIFSTTGEIIENPLARDFTDAIASLENTIFAEAKTKTIFVIEPRRYSSEYLLREPEKFFRDNEFDKLSELAKFNFRSACNCLLFAQSTAVAFHLFRATEEVLRQYHNLHKKPGRQKQLTWEIMTEELKKKRTKRPSDNLLYALDNIRESYKNPCLQADAIYDLNDAQNLFGLCVDVISQMSAETG